MLSWQGKLKHRKQKVNKWGFIKLEAFFATIKAINRKDKKKSLVWTKLLSNCMYERVLISIMYKELRLTGKKLQTKEAGKGCEQVFPALKYRR